MHPNNTSSAKRGKAAAAALEDRFEFIPYHSHYNPHTLLTKNGELMQIIRVNANLNGDECENLDGVHATLCTALREVLTASEVSEKFSFWLHTIRRRSEVPSREKLEEDKPSDDFAQYVEKNWERAQNWEKTYKNEVYLTILYEGQAAPLFDGKNPKFTLFPNANKKFRGKYLEDSYQILDKIVISVLEEITTQYRANRLTLVERALPSAGKVADRKSVV